MNMSHLQSELDRLYLPRAQDRVDVATSSTALVDRAGRVRAMVMELTRPADWGALSRVWHGVQAELELPAPAIAVSGTDGLQLWFSLAEPILASQAHDFLQAVRQRFLADIDASRLRLMPASDASALRQDLHAARVPAQQPGSDNWSAFLAPDLVPIFAESPWLDTPPNEEGQASLLRSIEMLTVPAFTAALAKLGPTLPAPISMGAPAASVVEHPAHDRSGADFAGDDPKQFLLQIMQDDTVALALRIEAAKALLQHASDQHFKPGG